MAGAPSKLRLGGTPRLHYTGDRAGKNGHYRKVRQLAASARPIAKSREQGVGSRKHCGSCSPTLAIERQNTGHHSAPLRDSCPGTNLIPSGASVTLAAASPTLISGLLFSDLCSQSACTVRNSVQEHVKTCAKVRIWDR